MILTFGFWDVVLIILIVWFLRYRVRDDAHRLSKKLDAIHKKLDDHIFKTSKPTKEKDPWV